CGRAMRRAGFRYYAFAIRRHTRATVHIARDSPVSPSENPTTLAAEKKGSGFYARSERRMTAVRWGSVDKRDASCEFDHRFTRDFGGGMVGRLGEKTLEILGRGGKPFEPVVERRAFEDFVNRARFEH